jgi:hypothetical protein
VAGGYRSLVAPWAGGASAPAQSAGYGSLVAFWLGGAYAAPGSTPPPTEVSHGGGFRPLRIPHRPRRIDEEDDEIAIILAAIHEIMRKG